MASKLPRITLFIAGCAVLASMAVFAGGCGVGGLEQVRLDSGPITGEVSEVDGSQIWGFKGIPYAAPPVGELRWKAPQPVEGWTDPRDCSEYGPACPQPGMLPGFGLLVGDADEDCLYLNVWSSAGRSDEGLPVMVWIHGGSFETGSGSMGIYDGRRLAARGVVVVTINYRLGPFGFLSHPALSAENESGVSGNYGLLDQIAALEWVQRNISEFGGDAGNVTVFGESAGGISILDLIVSPPADGLFHRAIVQSGVLFDQGFGMKMAATPAEAEATGKAVADRLGVDPAGDVAAQLRSMAADELLAVAADVAGERAAMDRILFWKPVVDGKVLPAMPTSLWMEGRHQGVSLLIGSNADEADLFAPAFLMTLEEYESQVRTIFGDNADEALVIYPGTGSGGPMQAMNRLLTEVGFASSARFAARMMARERSDVYLYEFTRAPLAPLMGAFHGVELPYVFGTLDQFSLFGAARVEDRGLSELVMGYWTRFAATGDPNGGEAPEWPRYESASDLHLGLGATVEVGSGLYERGCDLGDRTRGLR